MTNNEGMSKQMKVARTEARRNTGKRGKDGNGGPEEVLKKMGRRN